MSRADTTSELQDKINSYESFLESLLDPSDPNGFGWQVTSDVRDCARVLLGKPSVQEDVFHDPNNPHYW